MFYITIDSNKIAQKKKNKQKQQQKTNNKIK